MSGCSLGGAGRGRFVWCDGAIEGGLRGMVVKGLDWVSWLSVKALSRVAWASCRNLLIAVVRALFGVAVDLFAFDEEFEWGDICDYIDG